MQIVHGKIKRKYGRERTPRLGPAPAHSPLRQRGREIHRLAFCRHRRRPPYSRAGVDEAGTLVRSIDHTDGGTDTLDSRAGALAPIADNTTGPCLSTEPRLVQRPISVRTPSQIGTDATNVTAITFSRSSTRLRRDCSITTYTMFGFGTISMSRSFLILPPSLSTAGQNDLAAVNDSGADGTSVPEWSNQEADETTFRSHRDDGEKKKQCQTTSRL